ncbi:hypothetical protein HU200_027104 [Digitaria exilis]|uniref:Uncharacterized protein n=1 Tax=Digitaria exilis TaxID=1010633 RepID=A0A835C256_9POAL|nr:hypothetical protein HU200_027104 [Digitaria exilis]
MKQTAVWKTTSRLVDIKDKLHMKVADQLGVFEHNKYDMVDDHELRYYTYGMEEKEIVPVWEIKYSIFPQIMQKLVTKKYMLVIENLDEPISPIKLDASPEGSWFPPPSLRGSFWLVSTTSQDVYDRSKPPDYDDCVLSYFTGDDILILTLHSLKQAAKYISGAVGHEDEKYWHHMALKCFHYTTMLLIPDSFKVDPSSEVDVQTDVCSSENLIRRWAAQGILPVMNNPSVQGRMGDATDSYQSKYYDDDIYQVGNVILEAFQEYSLLQLPFSPATKDNEATKSAAHFLAYHSLVVEPLTLDELCEGSQSQLEHIQWVSQVVGDQGCHVSRDWLREGASGPSSLIIRHCSKQSRLFMQLESDHFLAKLPCLRVLDLSYTPLESLPPSICYLQELHLLSLRGCYDLRSPLRFPDPNITLCGNNADKKLNLLYLDLSYSNIKSFHRDFFHHMPSLKDLLLEKCSNLEELPTSVAALCTLTKIELVGNKKLLSFSGSTEISLDWHVTLSSFSLVGTPHIKRVSLRGCRKLVSVDIREVDALEELDLSATAIKEIQEDNPNLSQLKRLLLMGVPSLRRFPWHKLKRLPDVFFLDQCSDETGNHSHPQGAYVRICNSRLFYSFNDDIRDLVRGGEILKSFYVQVTSCKTTARKIPDEEHMVINNKQLQVSLPTYADVNRRYLTDAVSMVSMDDMPPIQETERHVEISAVDRYPYGLKYLLPVTKSIFMSDDSHVSCLSELTDFWGLEELEECKLQKCHQMVDVFRFMHVPALKNACVSDLKSLTHFFGGGYAKFTALLKHLRLEHCPRLEGIMPAVQLPRLRRIHLQELPLLEHLDVDNPILTVPMWEELHVRGCWSLRHLPRLKQQPDKQAVKVSGERAWWTKLRWASPSHRGSYEPRFPLASTSFRERVIIKSYLR